MESGSHPFCFTACLSVATSLPDIECFLLPLLSQHCFWLLSRDSLHKPTAALSEMSILLVQSHDVL